MKMYYQKNGGNQSADYFIITPAVSKVNLAKELTKAKIEYKMSASGSNSRVQFKNMTGANKGQQIMFRKGLVTSADPINYALKHKLIPKKVGEELLANLPTNGSNVPAPVDKEKVQETKEKATEPVKFHDPQVLQDMITKRSIGFVKLSGEPVIKMEVDVKGRKLRWWVSEEQKRAYWCAIENIHNWFTIKS